MATVDNKLVMNQPRRGELASHPLAPAIGIGYYQGDTQLTSIGLCVTTFILLAGVSTCLLSRSMGGMLFREYLS